MMGAQCHIASHYRMFLLFYLLFEAFVIARSLPVSDVFKMLNTTLAPDDSNTGHERNITLGSFTGASSTKRRRILPDPPANDPSWPINQYKDDTPIQCECAKCNKKNVAKELAGKAAKKAIRLHERQMAYILSVARKECRKLGLLGQIEIQASYCVLGVSLGSGAWTQLGKAREEGVYFPGGRPSTHSLPEEVTDDEVESGVFKRAVQKAVVSYIQLSLADMTERAAVWHDPKVFLHAAMDRSAITRNLVLAEPFLGSFQARLYFRLWLTDFPGMDVEKDTKEED